jgi:hypothetical protein
MTDHDAVKSVLEQWEMQGTVVRQNSVRQGSHWLRPPAGVVDGWGGC